MVPGQLNSSEQFYKIPLYNTMFIYTYKTMAYSLIINKITNTFHQNKTKRVT